MISQYANSPRFVALDSGLTSIFDIGGTLEDWYNIVFNLKTAQGFGLDIWGAILNQGRLLNYENPKLIDVALKEEQIVLRSSSTLWIPNGANFKSVVLARDYISNASLSGNGKYFVFFGNNEVIFYPEGDVYSGSQPTPSSQNALWYDTTNNLIKITDDSGSTWTAVQYSLPAARVSVINDVISAIDNIFNGFGYVGSTIFVLPGVSGYVPDGLNDEGQKKNEFFEITEVVLYNNTQALGLSQYIYYNSTTGSLSLVDNYIESSIEPSTFPCLWLDTTNNLMKYKVQQSDSWTTLPVTVFAQVYGDGTDTRPTNLNVMDIYSQKEETVYLQGAQVIDGVPYTDEQIEDLYRMTLFLKAMSNITNATLKSINDMFAIYFEGQCFAYEYDVMKIRMVVRFFTTKIERAIFTNLFPKPTGVLMGFEFLQAQEYFGFNVQGLPADEQPYAPADQKPFYW